MKILCEKCNSPIILKGENYQCTNCKRIIPLSNGTVQEGVILKFEDKLNSK